MNTGTDKQIGHALDKICRHPQFAGKQFGIIVIPDINAFEKFLAVFPVLWACIHLIHKAVFCPVELCGEIRHFLQETFDVRKTGGGLCHKVIFHLCHTVSGGFDDNVVLCTKVIDKISVCNPAGIRQHFHAGVFQPMFTKSIKAGFQKCCTPFRDPFFLQYNSPPAFLID